MEKCWAEVLSSEFQKSYMRDLQDFLKEERKKGFTIYPKEEEIFAAFCHTAFKDVKVVIIGQDPYHGEGQAHGLSFSVKKGVSIPPSLINIYKELVQDIGIKMPKTGHLLFWARQGVLLLNATLTVRKASARSHYGKGWERFTDVVVEKIFTKKRSVAFLLWGNSAKEKCLRVMDRYPSHKHLILTAAHPSFYSVKGFFGCRHFSKTNKFLIRNNKKQIDWQIE